MKFPFAFFTFSHFFFSSGIKVRLLSKLVHGTNGCCFWQKKDVFGAVNEYVRLQKVRYQFTYCETVLPADTFLGFPCPKFILQPFVENSLSHGYVENMTIEVTVENRENDLQITISDTGTGMTEEKLQNIRQAISSVFAQIRNTSDASPVPIAGQSGKGIGLSYVIGILFSYYQGKASLTVESAPDSGTRFCLILPKLKGCGYQNAEDTDCR